MKKLSIGVLFAFLFTMLPGLAQAQGPMATPAQGALEKISRILNQQSFSAKVVLTFEQAGVKNKTSAPIAFLMTVSQGKTRMEMDFSQLMGADVAEHAGMPPGLDKMITISRPDKKVMYQVIPGMNGYAETPIPDAAAGKDASSAKVDRKVEGTEKVENYDCEKVRNTITASDGKTHEVMTWEAKELKGLPVKTETETPEGKTTMLFKDIKTGKPADSLFEPPAAYKKHNSIQELMMSGMTQMMQQQGMH